LSFFDGGNIILSGGGSDHIMGRSGNDFIDGDAWLNVRIWLDAAAAAPRPGVYSWHGPLAPFMLDGTPIRATHIVRE
jgi:hypothetical protein